MPIHDFVQTMENKLYYNLVDVTNHLEKLESIHEEFDIINIQRKELINKRYELNNLILLKQKLENDKTGVSILLVPMSFITIFLRRKFYEE